MENSSVNNPDDDDDPDLQPLAASYVTSLLDFISQMIGQELASKRESFGTVISFWGVSLVAIVSMLTVVASTLGHKRMVSLVKLE